MDLAFQLAFQKGEIQDLGVSRPQTGFLGVSCVTRASRIRSASRSTSRAFSTATSGGIPPSLPWLSDPVPPSLSDSASSKFFLVCSNHSRISASRISFPVGFFAGTTVGASLVAAARTMGGPRQRIFNPEMISILEKLK